MSATDTGNEVLPNLRTRQYSFPTMGCLQRDCWLSPHALVLAQGGDLALSHEKNLSRQDPLLGTVPNRHAQKHVSEQTTCIPSVFGIACALYRYHRLRNVQLAIVHHET